MRILGIDPGLRLTGYGIVEVTGRRIALVDAGVIRTTLRSSLPERLHELYLGLREVMSEGRPTALAVEDIFAHPGFPRTAMIMGHVCGVLGLAAAQAGIPMDTIPPAAVKRAMVGSGRADKRQIQRMIRALLGLTEEPGSHVADALALALVAASRRGVALDAAARGRGPA